MADIKLADIKVVDEKTMSNGPMKVADSDSYR